MNILYGLLLFFVSFAFTSLGRAQDPGTFDLSEYRWKHRLLVVFAEQESTPAYQALAESVESEREEFDDRDMVMISLFEKGASSAGEQTISVEDVEKLRKRYNVVPGSYRVYLIGKDGGVKQKGGVELKVQELFALIDTMPMRRSEMRKKNSN